MRRPSGARCCCWILAVLAVAGGVAVGSNCNKSIIPVIDTVSDGQACNTYAVCDRGEVCAGVTPPFQAYKECGDPVLYQGFCAIWTGGTWDSELQMCVGGDYSHSVFEANYDAYPNPVECLGSGGGGH
ncbi:MAG TPA: hypothetical protein PLU35_10850 [Phycisphaerales bacterium]|nr:hypothetical protein [Phycisphaerales bacterium]